METRKQRMDRLSNQINTELIDAWETIYENIKRINIVKELNIQESGRVPTEEVYDELIKGLEQAMDNIHYGYKFFEK